MHYSFDGINSNVELGRLSRKLKRTSIPGDIWRIFRRAMGKG